tara:strand:+ start:416 stop:907 length:492 start_codon:yes stop_codon:yes gene_type:complete
MPLPETKKTVYLTELEAPECWVAFKTIYGLTLDELTEFNEIITKEGEDSTNLRIQKRFALVVLDWHLVVDGKELEQIRDNPNVKLPNYLTSWLMGEIEKDAIEFNERVEKGESLPLVNESETSSTTSTSEQREELKEEISQQDSTLFSSLKDSILHPGKSEKT